MNKILQLHLEEYITVYPQGICTAMQEVRKHLYQQGLSVWRTKPAEGGIVNEMDEYLCRLLWGQLQSIGFFKDKNPVPSSLKKQIGWCDLYDRWLEESIAILTRNNYLAGDGQTYSVTGTAAMDIAAVWKEWDCRKVAWLKDPNLKEQVVLVEASLRALPEILTGKRSATDVIFPNSSMRLVEGIYKNNPVADYFNGVLADTVIAYIEERLKQDPKVQIRMLEIGAGTGGTSAVILQKLLPYQQHIQEYCYTDISRAFLLHAEREYGPQNPYLTYKIFDVEAPIAGQGICAGGYDIAIATNVLHATPNISQTLRNAKAVLKKNGIILLNEISNNMLFTHLTFGLLEGWWLYEDPEVRIPGCPGLYPETWQELLENEGYCGMFFPVLEAHTMGQQIIIAESDGVVRQKQPLKRKEQSVKQKSVSQNLKDLDPVVVQDNDLTPIRGGTGVNAQLSEDYVRTIIIEKLSESLKVTIDLIDVDESFADYGVDSITGVHLAQIISQILEIELETTSLFNYSSVNQLTAYILAQYKDVIVAAVSSDVSPQESGSDIYADNRKKQSIIELATSPERSVWIKRRRPRFSQAKGSSALKSSIDNEPIAIIGVSGIFPMASDINEFWQNIMEGKDCITTIPEKRWDWREYYGDPKHEARSNVKWGGFINGVAEFDPLFFGISPQEAEFMDPQQRLFLENCWHCFEDAGLSPSALSGSRCGVFAGCGTSIYRELLGNKGLNAEGLLGNASAILAARISYFLNLKGPSLAIDTGCSSALVAIVEACNGLRLQTFDLALAGGVSVLGASTYITSSDGEMLSSDGRCFTFDKRANGFVPGEGAGVVLLKRLSDATRDQDPIYGVIRGWGTNQDGKTNGITAPSMNSQVLLQKEVYERFEINPETISLIETHGAATALGDPIEVEALTQSFQHFTDKKSYCALGTVKSNIGHLLAAAGAAGVIKVLLALRHQMLPPTIHYETLNRHISLHNSPFYINNRLRSWEVPVGMVRRAAVNSFGFSGTNAHIVIEEYLLETTPYKEVAEIHPGKPLIFTLSAQSQEQLKIYAEHIKNFIESQAEFSLTSMAYTLQIGRMAMDYRLAFLADSREELLNTLKSFVGGTSVKGAFSWLVGKSKGGVRTLEIDEDVQALLPSWIEKGKLKKVAESWVNGMEIDWDKLYGDTKPYRINLPTYPFAKECYWIPERKQQITATCFTPQYQDADQDQFFDQLLNDVIENTISIDEAVWQGKKRLEVRGE